MDKENCTKIALAVVGQAVDDWRGLCSGKIKENAEHNFTELIYFFEHDCDTYLTGTSMTAERILKRLMLERAMAKSLH